MDVFLIPIGVKRYELYCETPDDEDDPAHEADSVRRPFLRRLLSRFREALAEVERERHHPEPAPAERPSFYHRVKRWTLCRIAEVIAEQRLLWHLRKQHQAVVHYPDDLSEDRARALVRLSLQSDYEKHRRWLIIDGVLLVLAGALTIVPGPNVIAYYLAFRVVGHYFSMRGARQGLDGVRWSYEASPPLSELRQAIEMAPDQAAARVTDIAARLRLERLVRFFQRTVGGEVGVRS